MKIRPVEFEVLHWDGRTGGKTDIKRVNVTFQNFVRSQISNRQICIFNAHRCHCHINLLTFFENVVIIRGLTNYATGHMCIHYKLHSY
jgi:hypothetical protein